MIDDRIPPQNIEAEQGVLGSILLDNDCFHEIVTFLKETDFYRADHAMLFTEIKDLIVAGTPADAITLANVLISKNKFKAIGGEETLRLILDSVPSSANGLHYAQIVRQHSNARQVIEACNATIQVKFFTSPVHWR